MAFAPTLISKVILSLMSAAILPPSYNQGMNREYPETISIPDGTISLTSPSDSSFAALSRTILKTDTLPDTLAKNISCTAIISNKGDKPVVALSIVYKVTNQAGKDTINDMLFYSLDLNETERMILHPGESRFITPLAANVFEYSSRYNTPMKFGTKNENVAPSWCSNSKHITIMIDAAVFADGIIVGPDTTNTQDRLNGQIQAISDISNEVLDLHKNAKPNEISMHVHSIATSAPLNSEGKDKMKDTYYEVRQSYAALFEGYLQTHSEEDLVNRYIYQILNNPHVPLIHRSDKSTK